MGVHGIMPILESIIEASVGVLLVNESVQNNLVVQTVLQTATRPMTISSISGTMGCSEHVVCQPIAGHCRHVACSPQGLQLAHPLRLSHQPDSHQSLALLPFFAPPTHSW